MRAWLYALALGLGVGAAAAQSLAPFLPPQAAAPKILKILAPPDFISRPEIDAFEKANGATIALDAYAGAAELQSRLAAERYDLVALRGPALARRLGEAELTRLDRRLLPNARLIEPIVAAKYAAYDHTSAYGVPFGWSAFGILYDADKAREVFGGPPVSWVQVLGFARNRAACGVVWPDARDESFLAAWKMLGVDAARARLADVKSAGAVLERARGGFVGFAVADEVGALAKGAACLGAGTAGEAAAVTARGGDNAPNIRFAYPREGAPLALYAFVIPRNAAEPDAAYRFLNAELAREAAQRDAASAGLNSAESPTDLEILKRLTPEPVFDHALAAAIEAEWKRLTAAK